MIAVSVLPPKQINNIEGVQRRFMRRCYDGTQGSVIRLVNEQQCPSLEKLRK